MTIGIAAIASGSIIAASDQRFSYYDAFPPTERGANKIMQLTNDLSWWMAFAANDISLFVPLIKQLRVGLAPTEHVSRTLEDVMRIAAEAYSHVRLQQFVAQHLIAIGYADLDLFKKEGFHDLGKDEHAKHMKALYEFDLGVELILFGYTAGATRQAQTPRIFKVCNPGKIVECAWEGYAAVGTGCYLALGSLRQRPMPYKLVEMIYRVLEAKFVAEAASHVGQSTNLLVLNPNGTHGEMTEGEIAKIREAWRKTQINPIPSSARTIIEKCEPVTLAKEVL